MTIDEYKFLTKRWDDIEAVEFNALYDRAIANTWMIGFARNGDPVLTRAGELQVRTFESNGQGEFSFD